MKPKVALVKDGFLPAGSENVRGRLSLAAIDRLKELAGQGWSIDGYSVEKTVAATDKPTVVKTVAADPNRLIDIPDESRSENDWEAFTTTGPVGMRTVCNVCRSSLTHCHCQHPRVWIDHNTEGVVVFKPRKTPFKKSW